MLDGTWGGTMCLTEPQAGSDVGAAVTTASRLPDGTYAIKGTKIFISGGDHDMAENVVHLVLARVDEAPAGTKGLSLFIVPRIRATDDGALTVANDVNVPSIEHKMGINGSATCVVTFGDEGACVGELVGAVENHGMMQMFKMMNGARISVGIQGVAVASGAFLNALEYARDRKQGSSIKHFKDATAPRAAIIEHPNIRQDLLDMKARVEGIRAMIFKLAYHQDMVHAASSRGDGNVAYHQGQVDLLTPLVKAYSSDQAFRICEKAIQVHGGMGFTRDYPVEQACRDSKIFSIYEGTNAIQSMDLVTRKLMQNGGANAKAFLDDVTRFIDENREHAALADAVKLLEKAHKAVAGTGMQFMQWFTTGQLVKIPLTAERFLEMMSELCVGWLLLEQAAIAEAKAKDVAEGHPDRAFYAGKRAAGIYYAKAVLPSVVTKAMVIAAADTTPIEIEDASFATV
jgi:alkylation response protein AidB-like acyl-CoA dehydrogenase